MTVVDKVPKNVRPTTRTGCVQYAKTTICYKTANARKGSYWDALKQQMLPAQSAMSLFLWPTVYASSPTALTQTISDVWIVRMAFT